MTNQDATSSPPLVPPREIPYSVSSYFPSRGGEILFSPPPEYRYLSAVDVVFPFQVRLRVALRQARGRRLSVAPARGGVAPSRGKDLGQVGRHPTAQILRPRLRAARNARHHGGRQAGRPARRQPLPHGIFSGPHRNPAELQGRGLGSAVVRELQEEARTKRVPIRLQVIKANATPCASTSASTFKRAGETKTHHLMLWQP